MILLLHNRYRVPGGEERAVEDLAWLIRTELGEEVELLERDSGTLAAREPPRTPSWCRAPSRSPGSSGSGRRSAAAPG